MKKDQLRIFIVACLVVTLCAFGYATYAFYQTSFSGEASATFAEWNFDFLAKDSGEFQSLKGASYTLDLGKSCTNCVNTGDTENPVYKIQPGSTGKFMIKVDASSSEVKTISKVTMYDLQMGGNTNFPKGLKFYVNDGGTKTELSVASLATAQGVAVFDNSSSAWEADTADKSVERTIEWEWLYASDNDNAYSGKDISFSLKAVAEQVIENAG